MGVKNQVNWGFGHMERRNLKWRDMRWWYMTEKRTNRWDESTVSCWWASWHSEGIHMQRYECPLWVVCLLSKENASICLDLFPASPDCSVQCVFSCHSKLTTPSFYSLQPIPLWSVTLEPLNWAKDWLIFLLICQHLSPEHQRAFFFIYFLNVR